MLGIILIIYNYGIWGIIVVLKGKEKNIFWKCSFD